MTQPTTARVLADIAAERVRQDAKWGPQHHPDGTGPDLRVFGHTLAKLRDMARDLCDIEHRAGRGTWAQIFAEEAFEAAAEDDPAALRAELVQTAAVCVNWVEDIDSRADRPADGMTVYISGAITGLPLDVARARFAAAAERIRQAGHTPRNPFDVPPHHTCLCPAAEDDAGAGSGHDWGCYLRGDLAALLDCDAILMLPGWAASHGARLEMTVAAAVGLAVWWEIPATAAPVSEPAVA